ncbi:ribonuclease HI [Variovorax sp. OAS795]|uniref:ribonuclease H family protein n=1 Tax=Variovorax sp. OAS795 TaxID=3034231 RepID=UPI003398DB57
MIEIYTDGSCWPNPSAIGGWSFVAFENGREIHTGSGKADTFTSSNRMEQTAMLRALLWLGDRPAVLHSDSRYVVDGLNLWSAKWQRNGWTRKDKATKKICDVMNADLWQVMVIARQRQHEVRWIKGHAGHIGNERADGLAEAARMGATA